VVGRDAGGVFAGDELAQGQIRQPPPGVALLPAQRLPPVVLAAQQRQLQLERGVQAPGVVAAAHGGQPRPERAAGVVVEVVGRVEGLLPLAVAGQGVDHGGVVGRDTAPAGQLGRGPLQVCGQLPAAAAAAGGNGELGEAGVGAGWFVVAGRPGRDLRQPRPSFELPHRRGAVAAPPHLRRGPPRDLARVPRPSGQLLQRLDPVGFELAVAVQGALAGHPAVQGHPAADDGGGRSRGAGLAGMLGEQLVACPPRPAGAVQPAQQEPVQIEPVGQGERGLRTAPGIAAAGTSTGGVHALAQARGEPVVHRRERPQHRPHVAPPGAAQLGVGIGTHARLVGGVGGVGWRCGHLHGEHDAAAGLPGARRIARPTAWTTSTGRCGGRRTRRCRPRGRRRLRTGSARTRARRSHRRAGRRAGRARRRGGWRGGGPRRARRGSGARRAAGGRAGPRRGGGRTRPGSGSSGSAATRRGRRPARRPCRDRGAHSRGDPRPRAGRR